MARPDPELADETERTWVMFNNCKYDYAPTNAREMAEILGDVVAERAGGAATGEPVSEVSERAGDPTKVRSGSLVVRARESSRVSRQAPDPARLARRAR